VILTTQRLLSGCEAVDLSAIAAVKPAGFGRTPKRTLSRPDVTTQSGNDLQINLAAGSGYCALWNVLLHIANRNNTAASR
jgi:hypothetical protein